MTQAKPKTEEYINLQFFSLFMEQTGNLDEELEEAEHRKWFEDVYLPALAEYVEEAKAKGWDMKAGKSEDCMTFAEMRNYVLGRFSRVRRQRYDAHLEGCKTCDEVVEAFSDYIAQNQSQHPVAVLGRRLQTLPDRIRDHLNEARQEKMQQQQSQPQNYQ